MDHSLRNVAFSHKGTSKNSIRPCLNAIIEARVQHHQERINGQQAEAEQLAIPRDLNKEISHRFQRRDDLLLQCAQIF